MNPIEPIAGGVRLRLHVQPRASRTEVAGRHGDALKIRVSAPPVEGAANDALVRFLAARLGVATAAVTLAAGETGRQKTVLVSGVTEAAVRAALGEA